MVYEEFINLTPQEADLFVRWFSSVIWQLRVVIADCIKRMGGTVLDVGCGNGLDSTKYKKEDYIGVDVSPVLIESAKKQSLGYNFSIADARKLPFEDKSFDNVFCVSVIEHQSCAEDAKKIISEMIRVAKKQVLIGWHTPPGDNPTEIIQKIGHFGKLCYSNKYNYEELRPKSGFSSFERVFGQGYQLWRMLI